MFIIEERCLCGGHIRARTHGQLLAWRAGHLKHLDPPQRAGNKPGPERVELAPEPKLQTKTVGFAPNPSVLV